MVNGAAVKGSEVRGQSLDCSKRYRVRGLWSEFRLRVWDLVRGQVLGSEVKVIKRQGNASGVWFQRLRSGPGVRAWGQHLGSGSRFWGLWFSVDDKFHGYRI